MSMQCRSLKTVLAFWNALLILLFIIMAPQGAYAMSDKPSQFRFENYKTGEEAQAALLELHPIGSDAKALIERLRALGARCERSKDKRYPATTFCVYYEPEILFGTEWQIGIFKLSTDSDKISDVKVYSHFQSL